MLRSVLGAVIGYAVIALLIGVLLFGAYFALGAERSFQPRSYEPSTLWLGVMLAVDFVGALCGGFVARKVGTGGGVKALVALYLVLSLVLFGWALASDEGPVERSGDVTAIEAMQTARTPLWAMAAGLGVGLLGILVGAGKAGSRKR